MKLPMLIKRQFDNIPVYTDDVLFDELRIRIAFTGRVGGVSEPPFDSLNTGNRVGDNSHDVEANRKHLISVLYEGQVTEPKILNCIQVHGSKILCDSEIVSPYEEADGILVENRDAAALLCFADCVPVIVVDPSGLFAVVHAGWRGVYAHIALKAAVMLREKSGSDIDSMNFYIGPHIGSCHFEVGEDLAQKFREEFGDSAIVSDNHIDLSATIIGDLCAKGASRDRIVDSGICTVCNSSEYFSYRASKDNICGRNAAVAFRI